MRKGTRLLFLLMALIMIVVCSACGTATSAPTATAAPVSASASAAATTPPAATAKTYEKVTLTYLSAIGSTSGPIGGWLDKYLTDTIGVHIEAVACPPERMQASLASGELADLVNFANWNDAETAVKGNMLTSLDEHLDALPNVTANCAKALQFVRDSHSAGTGKAYCIPDDIGPYSVPIDTGSYAANVRWDIYKSIGAPAVNKMEDFLPVLKKMQEAYPQTKDGQKVYAFELFKDWDSAYMYGAASFFSLTGNFGGLSCFLIWDIKDNTTTPLLDPNSQYIRALKFYYQANKMGLVDPDSLTQTYDTALAKVGSGATLTAWNWNSGGDLNTDVNMNANPPVGFRPVMFDEFYASTQSDYPIGASYPTGIGSKTENLDACLRFLDLYCNTDALMVLDNGPKGGLWDYDNNDVPHPTDLYWQYMADSKVELPGGGALDVGGDCIETLVRDATVDPKSKLPIGIYLWPESIAHQTDNALFKDWAAFYKYPTPAAMMTAQNRIIKRPLAHGFISTIPDDIETLRKQIADIVITDSWLMVYAKTDAEFDSYYQDMVSKANTLGIQKVMDWRLADLKQATDQAAKYK